SAGRIDAGRARARAAADAAALARGRRPDRAGIAGAAADLGVRARREGREGRRDRRRRERNGALAHVTSLTLASVTLRLSDPSLSSSTPAPGDGSGRRLGGRRYPYPA